MPMSESGLTRLQNNPLEFISEIRLDDVTAVRNTLFQGSSQVEMSSKSSKGDPVRSFWIVDAPQGKMENWWRMKCHEESLHVISCYLMILKKEAVLKVDGRN